MDEKPIRRTPDGAIDMTYYLARGRRARSRAAWAFIRQWFGRAEDGAAPSSHPARRQAPNAKATGAGPRTTRFAAS